MHAEIEFGGVLGGRGGEEGLAVIGEGGGGERCGGGENGGGCENRDPRSVWQSSNKHAAFHHASC